MTKKTSRTIISMLLIAVMTMLSAVPAFARVVKDDPYGFTWLDESEDIWYFQYYEFDDSEDAYEVTDYAYLEGNKLYDKKGKLIVSNVYAMDDDPNANATVAFYNEKLYFINKAGEVCRMDSSTSSNYSKSTKVSNVKYFTLDADGLGSRVSNYYLSNLSFSGSYSRGTSSGSPGSGTPDKEGEYVLTYAYNGDPLKTAYDAYYDDELLISIYCKGSNVWVETEDLLLSDTCVGAKFVGYSRGYFTILYDLDGTMYCFAYDDFDTALPISFNEEIKSYTKDDDGFIESITTTRTTYDLEDLIEDYGYDEYEFDPDDRDDDDDDDDDIIIEDDIDSVKNSTSKSVAYRKTNKVVATLEKSNNYLYWEDEKLENSYKPTYFGITEGGYPVWINNDDELYYFNGRKEKLIEEDVTLIRYDNDGFAYQYKIGSKTYDLDLD